MPKQRLDGDEEDDLTVVEEEDQPQPAPEEDEPEQEQEPEEDEPEQAAEDDEEDEQPRRSKSAQRAAKERERKKLQAMRQRQQFYEARQKLLDAQRQIAERDARIAELESSGVETQLARIEESISDHERQLYQAIEAGDAKAQAAANRALGRLEAQKEIISRSAPKKPAAQSPQPPPSSDPWQTMMNDMPREFWAWSARHGDILTWSAAEKRVLSEIANELQDEGYTDVVTSIPELERRLRSELPHRFQRAQQRTKAPYDLRNAPPAGPAPTSNGRVSTPAAGPGRQLTAQERQLLQAMGRDPRNPEHVRVFIKANPRPVVAGGR